MSRKMDQFRRASVSAIIVAAAFAAACADDHSSAPTGPRSAAGSRPAGDAASMMQGTVVSNAKPVDQVGFTKVNYLSSEGVGVAAGTANTTSVSCPAGSIAVSGGYHLETAGKEAPPLVTFSGPLGFAANPTGWSVVVDNEYATLGTVVAVAFVLCAS